MKKIITSFFVLAAMFILVQSAMAITYTVTVPAGTKACYITGEMNGWSPSATPLTKLNETTYTVDLPNATESMKYQYLSGPDWKYIEKTVNGAAVTDRTWSAADVVVNWASVFTPDEREVTIEALVPLEVKVLYLVGSFNGWKSPSEDFKMTFDSETVDGKIFTIKVFSVDAINMEFKFVAGPAWSYEQGDPTTNFVYGTTQNTKSVVVNSFKSYFDPAKTGTINIVATVPAGTENVYIQGDFLGWDMSKAIEGVKNQDGTFSFSIPMVMSIIYRLYNKADWGYPESNEEGAERATRSAAFPADANTAVTVVGWKKTISAVSNIQRAENKIYASNQMLFVENVKGNVQIIDISGRIVEASNMTGTFVSTKLNKGLYIVKVDGATKKITVQ